MIARILASAFVGGLALNSLGLAYTFDFATSLGNGAFT